MSLPDQEDPRPRLRAEGLLDEPPPVVAGAAGGPSTAVIVGLFAVAAIGLFLVLNARRVERARAPRPPAPSATPVAASPSVDMQALGPRPVNPALYPDPPRPGANLALLPGQSPPAAPPIDPAQRLKAPAVVVDLQSAARPAQTTDVGASVSPPRNPGLPLGAAAAGPQNSNQAALEQLGRTTQPVPERAVATQIGNLSAVVTQGAMIPAVLETALSSDLPGYARAIVSRDVLSFDGRQVLIPRSSRLIGEYRSALSQGQSRVFVIWNRVIRPDGVSVQIDSPGADALGRGGLQGKVDRHFFSRFGGSILLSVLNAGVAAASRTPATQIMIGSPAAAAAAAGSASFGGNDVPPTIKIAQGEAIRIFVARDLDFSAVTKAP